MGKYEGIDSREIECCDQSTTTIEAGISFEEDDGQNILKFHFLDYIEFGRNGKLEKPFLHQVTKSMWLDKKNTKQLIKALRNLRF